MFITNMPTILKMFFQRKSIQAILDRHKAFKGDAAYTPVKLARAVFAMLKGEKVVRHDNQFVFTSFLPPVPSRAFAHSMHSDNQCFSEKVASKRNAPVSIYMALTGHCPCRCLHCSASARSEEGELTFEELKKTIDELQDMGTSIIGLTGGEPLLRDDLDEIVESIDDRSVSILFTGGFGLTGERARRLKQKGLFAVGISLDSYEEEAHNRIRRNNKSFATAVQAIRNARKAGLYTMAQVVIYRENLDKKWFFNYLRFVKRLGVQEVRVLEPIKSGALLEKDDAIFYTEADRKKLIGIHYAANRRPWFPKVTTFAHTESPNRFGCGAGGQHSYLSENGDLYPCDFVHMSFGNVRKESIRHLWREMNDAVGIPKGACFAMTVNNEILEKSGGQLPLNKECSKELCRAHQATEFPKIYRMLQPTSQ